MNCTHVNVDVLRDTLKYYIDTYTPKHAYHRCMGFLEAHKNGIRIDRYKRVQQWVVDQCGYEDPTDKEEVD